MKKNIILLISFILINTVLLNSFENNLTASLNNINKNIKTDLSTEKLEYIFNIINREKVKSPDGLKIGPYRNMKIPRHMTMTIHEEETYYKIIEETKAATREYKIDKRTGRIFDIVCKSLSPATVDSTDLSFILIK